MERLRHSPHSGLALDDSSASDTGVGVVPGAGVDAAGGVFAGSGAGADTDERGGGATMSGEHVAPGSSEMDYDGEAAAAAAAASAARMTEKMTGKSSGGPQTAVGYLLGELRMRPEEVGGLAGTDGGSRDAFGPCPVRATAACVDGFSMSCEALCILFREIHESEEGGTSTTVFGFWWYHFVASRLQLTALTTHRA